MPEMKVDMAVEVEAAPRQVWEWMADVPKWPEWTPFMKSSSYIKGQALEVGSRFKFKPDVKPVAITLKATITESAPPNRIVWEGGLPGLKAVHSFDFEDIGGGKTRVTTREAFTGIGVFFFRLVFPQEKLEGLHQEWLKAIQNKALVR